MKPQRVTEHWPVARERLITSQKPFACGISLFKTKGLLGQLAGVSLVLAIGVAGLAAPTATPAPTPSAAPSVMDSSAPAQPSPKSSVSATVKIVGPFLASPDVDSLIDLILNRNVGMLSYQAHAHLDIQQVDFPYLHPVLDGSVYYSAPGYMVYDFPNTPSYLQGITRVEGAVGMASRWRQCYNITFEEQVGTYILHMVPKIRGEVSEMDVTIDKVSGNPELFNWSYHDPADNVSLTQTFAIVNGFDVVTAQSSAITKHHIRVRGTGTFDTFAFNVPVPTPTPTPSDPLHQCDN